MFVTAVCFLFLLKLKWPKDKNTYRELLNADWLRQKALFFNFGHCPVENYFIPIGRKGNYTFLIGRARFPWLAS